jgi:hypothetical protein
MAGKPSKLPKLRNPNNLPQPSNEDIEWFCVRFVAFCTLEDPSAKPVLVSEQCLTDFPLARSFFTDLIRKTANLSMSASGIQGP